jgi:hypothetical protein
MLKIYSSYLCCRITYISCILGWLWYSHGTDKYNTGFIWHPVATVTGINISSQEVQLQQWILPFVVKLFHSNSLTGLHLKYKIIRSCLRSGCWNLTVTITLTRRARVDPLQFAWLLIFEYIEGLNLLEAVDIKGLQVHPHESLLAEMERLHYKLKRESIRDGRL